jgi:mannose-6-phosphate isomerase-like protein (cupin superfamily)
MTFILLFILLLLVALYIINTTQQSFQPLWHDNIETLTKTNTEWRKIIHTSPNLQIALMAPPSGEELGWEVHPDNDQFFRFESGKGRLMIRNPNEKIIEIKDGDAAVVPKGIYHNVVSDDNLKFYTIYGPPHHPSGIIDHTHKDEIVREKNVVKA